MAKTIQQLKEEWYKAATQAEKNRIHAEADKLRGFQTETTVTNGKYYQTPVRMEGQLSKKAAATLPRVPKPIKPALFRNAPAPTTITPEQQAANTQTLIDEMGKSRIARTIPGVVAGSPLLFGGLVPHNYAPEVQNVLDQNSHDYKVGFNPRTALHYRQTGVKPQLDAKITDAQIGEIGGNLISMPSGAGLGAAAAKGLSGLIRKDAVKAIGSIPAQTVENALNRPVQPVKSNLGAEIPKEQPFAENNGLQKDLGADVNKFNAPRKTSKVYSNTYQNSEMFSQAEKDAMNPRDYEYDPVSEKQSIAEAKQRLEADFNGEVNDLSNKAHFDGVDTDTAMGILEQYKQEARQTGDYSKVSAWSKMIQERGTESGQAVQAFYKYSRTPEGAVVKAQQTIAKVERDIKKKNPALLDKTEKEIDDILKAIKRGELPKPTTKKLENFYKKIKELSDAGTLTDDAIRELVKKKNGIPTLSDNDIKSIIDNMELSAKEADPYMKNMYANLAEQIIADKVPAEFREKFRALQRLSMILNPKTLITRNPGGNILLGAAENIKDIPGAILDKAISLKTGQRTTAFAPIAKTRAQVQGFGQGLSEWGKDIKYGVDTSPSRGQFELPSGRIFKNPVLNSLDQFERKALQLGDRPFYQAAYNSRIAELKKLGKVGEEAELDARLYALDRVFQNNSELSKRAIQIRKSLGLPGDLLMPFTQTPANILDKLIDYSPAGLGKAMYQLGTTVGKGTFDQKKFVDTLARTFTGGGIILLTYAMMDKGILKGSLSNNADVRNAEQLQGQQAYSIKLGDKWYSFDWAQPIAGIMAATADAIKAGAEKDDIAEAVAAGGTSAIDSVFNQSFLSGILTAFSGYSPASGIGAALLGSTSQATPTAGASLVRVIDPTVRETYDPNMFKQQANKLIARIPFASKTLPAKVDVKGETIMQSQGRNAGARTFENFLAPYKVSQESSDPVNKELMRLQSQTGESAVLLNKTPKSFTKDGTPYLFTTKEYIQYQKVAGQTAYADIQKLITTPEYQTMSDEDKAKAVKDIQSNAIETARVDYFKSKGLPVTLALSKSQQEKFAEVKSTGITDQTFYNIVRTADTDNNGRTSTREFNVAMRNAGLTGKQRQAMILAYKPDKKK